MRWALWAVLFLGCRPTPVAPVSVLPITIPPAYELEPAQSTIYVGHSVSQTSYDVLDFFSSRDTLANAWFEEDGFRIRTRPMPEPQRDGKFWRTTFMIKVKTLNLREECTGVEIRWVIETLSPGDSRWYRVENPAIAPDALTALKFWAQTKSCSNSSPSP